MDAASGWPAIEGFEILSELGKGGGGSVYLAVQTSLDRRVALKVLHAELLTATQRRRFLREAQILAGLRHPNLMTFLGYQGEGAHPYMVLEYLPGGTLRDRIRALPMARRGAMDCEDVEDVARAVLEALVVLHECEMVHRDVKPANIFFREPGQPVLGDLGLVKPLSHEATRLTGQGCVIGTMAYLPPEAYADEGLLTAQADLFALGVTLFESITGQHPSGYFPFTRDFLPVDPRRSGARCAPELANLIVGLLHPDPARRPASAKEALRAIGRARGPVSLPPPVARARPRAAAVLAATVALLASLGLARWVAPPPSAPRIHVQARARDARIDVSAPSAGMRLQVRDERGDLLDCPPVPGGASHATVACGNLSPGQGYVAQLFDGLPSRRAAPLAQRPFRTPAAVSLLGFAPTPHGPNLWISVDPPGRARFQGTSAWNDVGPVPSPLGPVVASARRPAVLELAWSQGTTAYLDILLPETGRPRAELAQLAVLVGVRAADTRIGDAGGSPRPLIEWLLGQGVGTLVVGTERQSLGTEHLRLLDRLRGRGGARCALKVSPEDATFLGQWAGRIGALSPSGPPTTVLVSTDVFDNSARLLLLSPPLDRLQGIMRITRALRAHADRLSLVVAVGMGSLPMSTDRRLALTPVLGNARGIGVAIREDSPWMWQHVARQWAEVTARTDLSRAIDWVLLQGVDVEQVRETLTVVGLQWLSGDRGATMKGSKDAVDGLPRFHEVPARSFILSRVHFPGATVLLGSGFLVSHERRTPLPAWRLLRQAADILAGLSPKAQIGRGGTLRPRLDPSVEASGWIFTDGLRRVQVLLADGRPGRLRMWPARPGEVSVAAEGGGGRYTTRVWPTTAPLDLAIGEAPVFYEELVPVDARSSRPDVVELATGH